MKRFAPLIFVAALAGCANYEPVPEDYVGPTATIADTGFPGDGLKAKFFVVDEIDGHKIPNALIATLQRHQERSFSQGFRMMVVHVERKVPIKQMTLRLRATHSGAAPILDVLSWAKGEFYSVEGIVTFTPEPDGRYVVKGELKQNGSSVWVANAINGERVTEMIVED